MTAFGVTGPAYWLVILALLIPGLSVSIRRLHDTNRTGWWVLISLIPIIGGLIYFVFTLLPGTAGTNRFGFAARDGSSRDHLRLTRRDRRRDGG